MHLCHDDKNNYGKDSSNLQEVMETCTYVAQLCPGSVSQQKFYSFHFTRISGNADLFEPCWAYVTPHLS